MFFQGSRINYDIVDINFRKFSKFAKKFVNLSLYINRRIFIAHYNYIEGFLISIIYDNKFITIFEMYFLLIKKTCAIDNIQKSTILD